VSTQGRTARKAVEWPDVGHILKANGTASMSDKVIGQKPKSGFSGSTSLIDLQT